MLGAFLYGLRVNKYISLEEVAYCTGICMAALRRIETDRKMPSARQLMLIMTALGENPFV
jgi:transcriptional regulator with XRE-family HTH domain